MKIQNVSKLTLAVLVAAQMLSVDVASAKAPAASKGSKISKGAKKFVQVIKTTDKEALKDPYYQLKAVNVRELTAEEALEFNNDTLKVKNVIPKDFTGPNLPNVPALPAGNGDIAATTADGPQPKPSGALDSIIMVIDKLIAIGQKIIPTIKEGKSVVTNNPMASVSVLPRSEAKDPVVHDMGGWSIPVSKHYKISYTNGLGMEVVSFVYSISYQYNGSADGKGKYLAGIRASARNITISWGFDLDASSQLLQISNAGTQQNVVAAATIEMTYTVKNWTKNITTSESFFVTGEGKLYKLD